ncbi:hypothetical protein D046_8313, partial [Vibrio parahaemolyticus V-223/04]
MLLLTFPITIFQNPRQTAIIASSVLFKYKRLLVD